MSTAKAHQMLSEGIVGTHARPELIERIADLLKAEADSKPRSVEAEMPDEGISVLALSDLDGWTVAQLDSGEWIENATGDRITVLKWMHLPPEE